MKQELSPLKRAFLALEEAQARIAASEGAAREPIAVIGLGCRVPGADDPAAFWRLLRDGVDAVGPVPGGRFDLDAVHDAAGEASGRSVTREAAFLRQVDEFDPGFFGIARREAQGMDPQQRLLLEVSWEALEHAGQAPDRLGLSATGVYFGICTSDYGNLQSQAGDAALIDAHYTSGLAHSVASGRVSYVLGLQGPSISIDTACSSSLVAVHLACQALRTGDCRMALAGGVNVMLSPDLFIAFSHSRMLAPDGRCKTFDAAADGFGRGEGCGVIVLKRLSDARADGDRILALIRGSAVNQDGPSSGLTAPNGPSQEAVIREALSRGRIEANDVGYVEAHGTGTQLGDPLEMGALGAVFGPGRDASRPLLIGSVKTNLGHLEAAAGITGLIKLVLALRHRAIPPHLHFRTPSPHIPWSELAVRVPDCLMPWEPIGGRRVGGVSSFGYSGTNAHVVVEEAPEERRPALPPPRAQLFLLSGRDEKSLRALAGRYADALAAATDDDVADACFTAATARAQHSHRAALVVRSMAELREGLGALAAGRQADGVRTARVTRRDPARLAFLFPGQGAQYAGMAQALYETEAVFRDALDRCAAVLDPLLARPLLTVIHPAPGTESPLDETAFTQPALFAVEYALAQLWRAWGLRPDAVIGHSVGEYVAACLAGVFPLDDALRLIAERGRLMQTLPAGGAMAAIFAGVDDVRAAIAPWADRLAVAALNGAAQTVISGDQYAVDEVSAALVARGVRCQRLAVSHAFHSQLVEPVLEAFERAVGTACLEQPSMRLVSNVTGSIAGSEVATPEYWRRHMRDTVRFADGLKTLAASVADVWVEVGPHATLLPLAEEATAQGSTVLVPTLRRGRDDLHQLAEALGTLFLAGVPVDWRAVWSSQPALLLDLPPYPFQRERCWFPQRASAAASAGRATGHPLLGTRLRSAQRDVVQYEVALDAETLPFFRDHQVGGRAILPATGFIEMALAAGRALGDSLTEIHDLVLLAPLVAADDVVRIVQVVVRRTAGGATFEILSQNQDDADAWQMHAQGALAPVADGASFEALDEVRARCPESLDAAAHQAALRARDLTFGPSLHGVRNIRRRDGEAIGEIVLPDAGVAGAGNYVLHPALLDACLQVMSAALPSDDARAAFLPFSIDRVRVHRASAAVWSHVVQRSPASGRKDTLGADVRVFDAGGLVAEITGITLRAAATDAAVPVTAGCRYEIQWMPEYDAAWMPQAETLALQAGSLLADLVRRHGISAGATSFMEIEAFSTAWVRHAFARLGWAPSLGEHVMAAEVAARLGVAPRYHRLLARLLGILAEDGLLRQADGGWCVVAPVGGHDPAARRASLLAAHPERSAMITLVANCGAMLADILRGDADPLQALFPGGSTELAESLYRDAPEARACNELTRETLMAAVAVLPRGRRLRVLEVGGGTGGTTACIAPALPADATEYLFTDVGPLLVARARERFAGHPFMQFQTLDLEQEPSAQGLEGRCFDVILAANVIHATADLRKTLGCLRGLLAPGGMLLMLEVTAPERWIDVTFGLTDGWWRFTDTALRPAYPLLARTQWLELLSACGFEAAAVGEERTYARAALLAARRTAQSLASRESARWLLLADEGGVGTALTARLRKEGHEVTLLRSDRSPTTPGEGLPVDTEDVDEVRRAVASHLAGATGVVHLWSLDLAPPPDAGAGTPVDAQRRSLGSLLGVVQALGGASFDSTAMPRLWVATCGAQAVTPAADVNVAQAPIWGMGRVIELEHQELRATRVDLDENVSAGDRAADLLGILLSHSVETQVAVRSGTRHVARLVRLDEPAESVPMQVMTGASGVLDDLTLIPATRRHPAPGEVEIRVRASGLNFRDVLNAVAMRSDPEPLGGECVGRIVAVGEGVSSVAVGDDVLAIAEGCFATYVTADARFVAPLPNGVGHAEAATVPLAFMTAHHALLTRGGILEGETVLIHAGAGGVGMAAIQVAQHAGAVVLATAGSDRKRAALACPWRGPRVRFPLHCVRRPGARRHGRPRRGRAAQLACGRLHRGRGALPRPRGAVSRDRQA